MPYLIIRRDERLITINTVLQPKLEHLSGKVPSSRDMAWMHTRTNDYPGIDRLYCHGSDEHTNNSDDSQTGGLAKTPSTSALNGATQLNVFICTACNSEDSFPAKQPFIRALKEGFRLIG